MKYHSVVCYVMIVKTLGFRALADLLDVNNLCLFPSYG